MHLIRRFDLRIVLSSLILAACALPGAAQGRGKPAEPLARPSAAQSGKTAGQGVALRGVASPAEENEGTEKDALLELGTGRRSLASTASGASAGSSIRLASHPRRDELARWLEQSLRDKEIDVVLLAGRKYMLNDCLGIKASAGRFRLKLANPSVRFDNTGIVLTFKVEHVSLSALKLRMRPNPNVLELCKFSKKFEVGGDLEDVRLTLHIDPLYDLERCRLGGWGDCNPEVRIGNLNLKPLQNNLDAMGKDMVEDALTFALQVQADGMLSALGDLMLSAIDQFLEADCPTKPGEAGRATPRAGGVLGGAASSGTGPAEVGAGERSGGEGLDVATLRARIDELEARLAECEAGGAAPTDLAGSLEQAIRQLEELTPGAADPGLRPLLARLVTLALERAGASELEELARLVTTFANRPAELPGTSGAPRAWFLVANPELKGRVGRVVVRFPDASLASDTHVALLRDGKKVTDRYGEATWEALPGVHEVVVMYASVADCEVRAGHDTVVCTGMLAVELGPDTLFRLFRKGAETKLYDHYGSATIGLPVGEYEVEVLGQRSRVVLREGQITRF